MGSSRANLLVLRSGNSPFSLAGLLRVVGAGGTDLVRESRDQIVGWFGFVALPGELLTHIDWTR